MQAPSHSSGAAALCCRAPPSSLLPALQACSAPCLRCRTAAAHVRLTSGLHGALQWLPCTRPCAPARRFASRCYQLGEHLRATRGSARTPRCALLENLPPPAAAARPRLSSCSLPVCLTTTLSQALPPPCCCAS